MAKTNEEKLEARLREIDDLKEVMEKTRARLLELTGLSVEKSKSSKVPEGFQLGDAVISILREVAVPMMTNGVVEAIVNRFGFRPDRKNVQSSLDYLVRKGILEKSGEGRGNVFYSLKI